MAKRKQRKSFSKPKSFFFKIRLLNNENVRWLYKQRVKLNLNNINTNETDVEKEWENLQITLKLTAYKSLGNIDEPEENI